MNMAGIIAKRKELPNALMKSKITVRLLAKIAPKTHTKWRERLEIYRI